MVVAKKQEGSENTKFFIQRKSQTYVHGRYIELWKMLIDKMKRSSYGLHSHNSYASENDQAAPRDTQYTLSNLESISP